MNFSQRARVAARAIVETVRFAFDRKATPFIFPSWGLGDLGIPSLIDYLTYADEGYGRNAIVHACVREISRSAPSARLQVQRKLANAQSEPWERHYLQAVFNRPNPYQSQTEFVELYYTYLNIDGNTFIIRERQGRKTTALWLPRPDRMRPVVQGRDLVGFVYVADNGERIPWMVEEVIHVKEPNPSDPFEGLGRGLAPLSAAAVETDVDNRATAFMKSFFDNAAVPFGLLKSKNILSDEEVRRIRARIKSQYSGERNWWELMILDADADYQRMGLDLQEMAFPDLRAISETRICATFKVPPILIGIKAGLDASTYSNYTQARRAMWEDKIIPDNNKLSDKLTAAFADELGPDGMIAHDYSKVVALQEDRNNRFSRANQGVNGGWITVNEARREVGLAPVRGGDVFLRPLMSQAQPGEGNQSAVNGQQSLPLKVEVKAGGLIVKDWEEWGGKIAKQRDLVSRAWETRYRDAAKDRFDQDAREIEAILRDGKGRKAAVPWGDIEREIFQYLDGKSTGQWAAEFRPLISGLLDDAGDEWADELGIDWDYQNPAVQAFLQKYSLHFAERIGLTTKEALRALLAQGMEEGWQITKLISEIGLLYDAWRDFQRAEMIARSETIRALNAGANEAYRQAGVTEKQWYTAADDRTCEFCGQMHGRVVGVEVNFANLGDQLTYTDPDGQETSLAIDYEDVGYPPLHPDCRCTVLPVVKE